MPQLLFLEVWKTHLGTISQIPSLNPTHPLPTSLDLRSMNRSPYRSQNCLKICPPPSNPLGRLCFPPALPYLWSVSLLGTGWYLFVYEWTPPQLALLPAQQYSIPSLGFPPAAGLGHLAVRCQQPKHRGRPEIFGPIDPTAAKLEESRKRELGLDQRGLQALPGPSSLCPLCDRGDAQCVCASGYPL